MNGAKNFLMSRTIWGIGLTVIGLILNGMGYTFTDADQHGIMDAVANILDAVGPILATYGRVVATKKIA